ncbi:MAG: TIM barrel protein, partial [Halobacteriaceae archaeon]
AMVVDEIQTGLGRTGAMWAAEAAGVTLGLETGLAVAENRALVEAIDSPRVQLYYDVGNAARFGHDPAADLRDLADVLAPRIHLKDGTDGPADSPLGDGRVDFAAVGDALAAIDYDEWLVFETMYEDDPAAAMAANLRFAREHFE